MDENRTISISLMARLLVFLVPLGYLLFYLIQGKFLLLGNTDHVDAQLPSLFAAKNALAAGQWPWWNPYIFNGTPLWGSTGVFLWYPLTWVELLAPRTITLQVSTIIAWLQYFGVFLAAFLYFRILIGDEKWASFSALSYGFSISVAYGLAVGNAYLPVYIFLPLSLYILHSYNQRSPRKNIIFLAISLFCLFTGGFLQLMVYAMAILGSYVLFLGYQSNSRKEAFSFIGMFAVSLFIAILLSAPAWLSTLYMARFVSRTSAANNIFESILQGGYVTPIAQWLRLWMPTGFGFGMWVPPVSYVETIVAFCGVSSLFLAGIALVSRPKRIIYYWAGYIVISFLLVSSKLVVIQYFAFGGVEMMYGRLVYLLPLGIASMAGMGGRSLFETGKSRRWLLIINPFNILFAVFLFLNRELLIRNAGEFTSNFQQFIESKSLMALRAAIPEIELLRAAFIIFMLALVFIVGRKLNVIWGVTIFLMLAEVVPSTYLMHKVQVNPLMVSPSGPFFAFDKIGTTLPFSTSDLMEFRLVITEHQPSRKENEAPYFAKEANQGSVYSYQSPWGYANGYSENLAALIQTAGVLDLTFNCSSKGLIHGNEDILYNAARQVAFDPLCHPRLSDLMSVGAVIKAKREWRVIADRRGSALPRATLFYQYEVIPDSVEALTNLAQDGFDIHKTLILEKGPSFEVGPPDPGARSALVKNTPNVVVITTHSSTPALLLLTDTYYPGWKAEIDDQPAEIIRSNVAFRSVWVPQGEHTIVFRYDPPLLTSSLLLGLAGVICLMGVAGSSKWRFAI